MRRKGLWRLRHSSARNPDCYRSRNRAVDRTCKACRCQAAQAASCKIRSTVSGQRRGDKYGQSWLSSFRFTVTAPMRALLNPDPAWDPRIETAYDVLFTNAVAKAPPIRPVPMTTIFFMLFLGLRLADTFNNESVIDCPLPAVLRDTLVCFAIVPMFRRLYVREFCHHHSLNGIALQDFVLPISHKDFNWMSFHCRFNSGPISLKLLMIQCFCSSENDVSGHDCSPFMGKCDQRPPEAAITSPVIHDALSEAKNTARGAMSSGYPVRPSGVLAIPICSASLPGRPKARVPSVSTIPGKIALMRIFFFPL